MADINQQTPYQSTHTGQEIDAGIDLLDSNSATQGQVLTANGTGGASWQDTSGGGMQPNTFTVTVDNTATNASGDLNIISYENGVFSNHSCRLAGNYTINNAFLVRHTQTTTYIIHRAASEGWIDLYVDNSGSGVFLLTADLAINVRSSGGSNL